VTSERPRSPDQVNEGVESGDPALGADAATDQQEVCMSGMAYPVAVYSSSTSSAMGGARVPPRSALSPSPRRRTPFPVSARTGSCRRRHGRASGRSAHDGQLRPCVNVSRAVHETVTYGWLATRSTTRCLIVATHAVAGGLESVTTRTECDDPDTLHPHRAERQHLAWSSSMRGLHSPWTADTTPPPM
jgi:hypothetical protein